MQEAIPIKANVFPVPGYRRNIKLKIKLNKNTGPCKREIPSFIEQISFIA